MSQSPDPTVGDTQGFGRSAILRFVERVNREIGPSPSFTGPAVSSAPTNAPERGGQAAAEQLSAARERAIEAYPGPIGELVVRELEAAAAFGFRFARCTLHRRLVDHLLQPPRPGETATEPGGYGAWTGPAPRIASD